MQEQALNKYISSTLKCINSAPSRIISHSPIQPCLSLATVHLIRQFFVRSTIPTNQVDVTLKTIEADVRKLGKQKYLLFYKWQDKTNTHILTCHPVVRAVNIKNHKLGMMIGQQLRDLALRHTVGWMTVSLEMMNK